MQIKIKKLEPNAMLPEREYAHDAGLDIFSNEAYTLQPGERHVFCTGIASELPVDTVGLFWDRGSLGSKGIHVLEGVLDSNYRGEWKVILLNTSDQPYTVERGYKIAQCIIQRYEPATVIEVEALEDSDRGSRAFGSTGV